MRKHAYRDCVLARSDVPRKTSLHHTRPESRREGLPRDPPHLDGRRGKPLHQTQRVQHRGRLVASIGLSTGAAVIEEVNRPPAWIRSPRPWDLGKKNRCRAMIGAAIDLDTDKVDRLLMRTDSDGFDMLTVAVKTLREQLAVR